MKNLIKLLTAFCLVAILVILQPAPASAASSPVSMTKITDTSFTITWEKPSVNGTIQDYIVYDYNQGFYVGEYISGNQNSYTFSGLKKGYVGHLRVDCEYTSVYGGTYTTSVGDVYVNTTPVKLALDDFGFANYYGSSHKGNFTANKPNGMTGTQIEIYKGSKKTKTMKFTGSISDSVTFKMNAIYKYRVRTYYSNRSTGKTYYGAWSKYRYFVDVDTKGNYVSNKRGCTLKLLKVSGVKNYTISVSTKEKSGYKKTATVTVSSGKSKSVLIDKIGKKAMKKNVRYYIKITPNIKVGDGTKASDVFQILYFTNPK